MARDTTPRNPRIHAAAIHYFDAVRRAGSIREAARRLNIASSAVNRQILKLEAEIGSPLFERLPGGLRLTAAGEVLARHVLTVLRDVERVRSDLDALEGLRAGHVELVTLEGCCHRIVPAAIAALHERHPRISIGARLLESAAIPAAILTGEAHLGLAFEVRRRPELRQLSTVPLPLGLVVRRDSPLAGKPFATLRDCAGLPLVLPRENFANRDQLQPLLFQAGLSLQGQVEAGSIELMRQLVLCGLGVAFMTRVGLEAELEAGRLAHVPLRHGNRPVTSELGLYAGAGQAHSGAVEAFARQIVAQLGLCVYGADESCYEEPPGK
ncbi:LysR family transcriptional regulator [Roseomonas marmotae]|uniref:LysR family transcriptional regulator n=1 Tax=Roseomonas marmotae TaxID=2768161 RepID=UPI001F4927AE|nr:LysR family transcriptional regulator [Roseomonas marmotae]